MGPENLCLRVEVVTVEDLEEVLGENCGGFHTSTLSMSVQSLF